jgi:hypothetical protein
VEVRFAALEETFSVRELFPVPGTAILAGEKLAETLDGNALAESTTFELNPVSARIEIGIDADPPRATDT